MAINPLDPSFIPGTDRQVKRGHGTGALGPSDSSDGGSDVRGGSAPAEIGDAELDSDTDRFGTGERRGAAPDTEVPEGADISPDHVEEAPEEDEGD
jgi:hypothetical protein